MDNKGIDNKIGLEDTSSAQEKVEHNVVSQDMKNEDDAKASVRYKRANTAARILRTTWMVLIVIISITLGQLHQLNKAAFVPIDNICPFGGLESLYSVFAYGMFLQKIAWGSLVMLAATIIIAIVFRRAFCGYICPLGGIQEFFGWLGNKVFKKKLVIPPKIDKWLRYLKYVVLVLVLYLTYTTGQLIIRPYDPWATLHHITSDELFTGYFWGMVVLVVTIVGSFLYRRFFCKYLCPMGAFLAIISKIGITKIKRDADVCTNCKICDKECPVNIEVSTKDKVTSAECISCNKCVIACPAKDALKIGAGKSKKGLNALSVTSIVIIIFVVIILLTSSIGMLRVSKIPKGFPLKSYGLYISEEMISEKNNLAEICYVYRLNPQYFIYYYNLQEEDFYKPMKDIGFDHNIVVDLIKTIPESDGCGSSGCD